MKMETSVTITNCSTLFEFDLKCVWAQLLHDLSFDFICVGSNATDTNKKAKLIVIDSFSKFMEW